MIAAAAAAAVIALFLLLPVGARVRYDGEVALQLAIGPVRVRLLPAPPPNYRRLARKQERARRKARRKPQAAEKKAAVPKRKLSAGQLRQLAAAGLRLAGRLPRKLLIRQLTVRVTCGGQDAAAAATAYGRAWAAIGALSPVLEQTFRIRERAFSAELDYEREGLQWFAAADVQMRVGTALLLGVGALAELLPILMNNKKKAVQQT